MELPEFLWQCSGDLEITKSFIFEILLSFTWCRRNTPNYQENDGFLENGFRLYTMIKVCKWRFLSFFGTAQVTRKLQSLLFSKFHWVWRNAERTPQIIKKMTNFWKIVLGSRQCWKCVDGGSWVSLALLRWLKNYKSFYFESFTEFDVMSEECPKSSRKWRISGKLF